MRLSFRPSTVTGDSAEEAVIWFEIAYYSVSEGRWGATPGKALVRLDVVGFSEDLATSLELLERHLGPGDRQRRGTSPIAANA